MLSTYSSPVLCLHYAGRKKLRLYEYLHEALHDVHMVDSIQWTDRGTGTFHFISKNKEKLAECWGQRKGNRKAMTYQKMARALRNYSRTGEIVKVRRKLTYQFNPVILQRLETVTTSGPSPLEFVPHHQIPAEPNYYCPPVADWHNWYSQCPFPAEYDFTSALTSAEGLKTHDPSQWWEKCETFPGSALTRKLPQGINKADWNML